MVTITRGARHVLITQALLILAFLLLSAGYYYAEAFRHPVSRMRGPAFTPKDVAEIGRQPVQAPYLDLDAYRQVYQVLHRDKDWPALGQAYLIALNQLATGQAVALPSTVQEIVAPEFKARKHLDESRDAFRKQTLSVQAVLEQLPPVRTLHHFPVRAGETYFVHAGGGLWARGKPFAEPQAGPLQTPGALSDAEYFFPLRVNYLGKLPVRELIFQVFYDIPLAPALGIQPPQPGANERLHERQVPQRPGAFRTAARVTCIPERHDGKAYSHEHGFAPGDVVDMLCPLTDMAGPTPEEASAMLRRLVEVRQPNQVSVLQQHKIVFPESHSPYAGSLLSRAEWFTPTRFQCGANLICRACQVLQDVGILPVLANLGELIVIASGFAASLLVSMGRFIALRGATTYLLPGLGLGAAITTVGGMGGMLAVALIPLIAGGFAVGSAWTHFLLSRPE